jgi:hypothetical protein
MIKEAFLACALAMSPGFVEGPHHKSAAVKIFQLLAHVVWNHPGIDLPNEYPTLLIIGTDATVKESLRAVGWFVYSISPLEVRDVQGSTLARMFPFKKHSAWMIYYKMRLPMDPFTLREMVVDVGRTIEVSGYFIVPKVDDDFAMLIFKSCNFFRLPFQFDIEDRSYSIYQKGASHQRNGFVLPKLIRESA